MASPFWDIRLDVTRGKGQSHLILELRRSVTAQEHEYHGVQAERLAEHLHMLPVELIWVDQNPMSFAVHGKPARHCVLHVNAVAHSQVGVPLLLTGSCSRAR